ncbi:hypothetical protein [Parapedobacter lycopersici]|uniref:hypothetical protein n=1 Tax=Parapedobacter lycopersici TaxID=1864939 RepID=UPI00214DF0AF|nr:hypothetical protein [Parapedobacter lycopersici]
MNGYDLHRQWFDFAFANQGLVTPTHTAMYAWFVELNNRMGWVDQFNCPASQTMAAIGVKHHSTYKKTFDDLVEFGFVKVIEEAKNQWTACVIALSKNDEARSEALDKAIARHMSEQPQGTYQGTPQGTCDINKPLNLETLKPLNLKTEARKEENFDVVEDSKKKEKNVAPKKEKPGVEEFVEYGLGVVPGLSQGNTEGWMFTLRSKFNAWSENGWKDGFNKPIRNWKTKIQSTIPYLKPASNAVINQTREQRIATGDPMDNLAQQILNNAGKVYS